MRASGARREATVSGVWRVNCGTRSMTETALGLRFGETSGYNSRDFPLFANEMDGWMDPSIARTHTHKLDLKSKTRN